MLKGGLGLGLGLGKAPEAATLIAGGGGGGDVNPYLGFEDFYSAGDFAGYFPLEAGNFVGNSNILNGTPLFNPLDYISGSSPNGIYTIPEFRSTFQATQPNEKIASVSSGDQPNYNDDGIDATRLGRANNIKPIVQGYAGTPTGQRFASINWGDLDFNGGFCYMAIVKVLPTCTRFTLAVSAPSGSGRSYVGLAQSGDLSTVINKDWSLDYLRVNGAPVTVTNRNSIFSAIATGSTVLVTFKATLAGSNLGTVCPFYNNTFGPFQAYEGDKLFCALNFNSDAERDEMENNLMFKYGII